jgi:preprotein translocase subunit SecD/SecD/SecF fusion protein
MLQTGHWRVISIVGIILLGVLFALPSLLPRSIMDSWPSWLPREQVALGLDLQGGAYLLYQVDRADYAQKRSRTLVSDARAALTRAPRIQYTGLAATPTGIQVRITNPNDLTEARNRLTPLRNPISDGGLGSTTAYEFDLATGDDGVIRLTQNPAGVQQRMRQIVQQAVEVIDRRLNELGTKETSVQREGDDRVLVEAPGQNDPSQLKELVGQTAALTFHLVRQMVPTENAAAQREVGTIVIPSQEDPNVSLIVEEAAAMTGEDLANAQAGFDQRSNIPIVDFTLTGGGAAKFARLTTQNVGKQFAIVLDDKSISAPVIREPITGGRGQISGNFTVQTANNLAILLRAGALPAKLAIVEERTIGPSLGADSIRAGITASIVATVTIIVFMIACYGILGLFANIALIAQNFLMLGILSMLGATLTLPGIAGIVLTMGMAVDANVLIYERMREEAHAGRSVIASLDTGFTKALATIVDAHLTALIAAIALFTLGSGPIRGFAVTLAIGIISTLFTAYLVTRLIVSVWVRYARPKAVPL